VPADARRPGSADLEMKEKLVSRYAVGAFAALMVCLAAGSLFADYDSVTGQIKSIDAAGGKLVISVRQGRDAEAKDTTFLVDKDTTVRINREKKALGDLTEGAFATVFFKEADGNPKALLVNVMQRRSGGAGGPGGAGDAGGGGRRGGAGAGGADAK